VGPHDYHGELTVRENGANSCAVTVAVHTDRVPVAQVEPAPRETVNELIRAATADADSQR
jgi:hypothetical protein